MPTLLVKNATLLVTMDDRRREIPGGGIFVREGFIEAIGPSSELPLEADQVLDLRGHLVLPGLINTHHHFYQTLTRAVPAAQDANLFNWLKTLYPIWAHMNGDDIYISTQTALAELALSGCTTASDHLYLFPNGARLDDELDVSVGTGAQIMKTVDREDIRKLGKLTFFWKAFDQALGRPPHRFHIVFDGKPATFRADELIIANCAAVGIKSMRLDPNLHIDDGKFDICRIQTRNVFDVLALGWRMLTKKEQRDARLACWQATEKVRIESHEKRIIRTHRRASKITAHSPLRSNLIYRWERIWCAPPIHFHDPGHHIQVAVRAHRDPAGQLPEAEEHQQIST